MPTAFSVPGSFSVSPELMALGFFVGAFGTLIGAGGGFLLVPLLLVLYPQAPVSTITATSLSVVFLNALSGSVAYARLRLIDYRTGGLFALAGAPGAILGALMTRLIPRGAFDAIFGLLLVSLAIYLFFRGRVVAGKDKPDHVDRRLGTTLSFGVGFFSSLFGIGGGIIHVPLLTQLLGYPAHVAAATSQFILLFSAFMGAATHVAAGGLMGELGQTVAIGSGAVLGAQFGARIGQYVHGRWLLRGLALAILTAGTRLFTAAVFR